MWETAASLLLLLIAAVITYCAADDSDESEEERACGTTATVCLVRQDRVVVANVGDSRAVLCRNGTAVDLSTEHRSGFLCLLAVPAALLTCWNGTAVDLSNQHRSAFLCLLSQRN